MKVQLTLRKLVYTDPEKLEQAVKEVQAAGRFTTLDTRYAARLGVLSGELREEHIRDVELLDVVSSLQRNEPMSAMD